MLVWGGGAHYTRIKEYSVHQKIRLGVLVSFRVYSFKLRRIVCRLGHVLREVSDAVIALTQVPLECRRSRTGWPLDSWRADTPS